MMSANKLSISFHDFDAHGDCCADITLPVSGTVISGFKVKPGMGGGIQVHMLLWRPHGPTRRRSNGPR